MFSGTPNRLSACAGCHQGASIYDPLVICSFASSGFPFSNGSLCAPCGVCYHPPCFKAGPPFHTRRKNGAGLALPKSIRQWAHFICEKCTVRSVLDRELRSSKDWRLMALERMRILDMAHAWSLGTHGQYQTKLNAIRTFEQRFGVSVLKLSQLHAPPNGPEVTLSWTQEQYGLRRGKLGTDRVTFGTIRSLRSAASQFFAWDRMITHPSATITTDNRILNIPCRPTDDYSGTLLATGMSARIGNETSPSQPLLARHVHWLDEFLHHRYQQATSLLEQRELAQAGFATSIFWLGWLRSSELFNRTFADVRIIEPADHASADLPQGVGMVTVKLGMDTKGRRDLCEDVVLAYTSYSGFGPGRWFHRLRRAFHIGHNWLDNHTPIFLHPSGTLWTSKYFRETFLWPSLREQQRLGDRYLQAFRGDLPGNTIESKFWSLHCFRRGARSHVSRKRPCMYKKATKDQVYEHARWSRRRQAEAIDIIYRQWTFRDRIELTLYSM